MQMLLTVVRTCKVLQIKGLSGLNESVLAKWYHCFRIVHFKLDMTHVPFCYKTAYVMIRVQKNEGSSFFKQFYRIAVVSSSGTPKNWLGTSWTPRRRMLSLSLPEFFDSGAVIGSQIFNIFLVKFSKHHLRCLFGHTSQQSLRFGALVVWSLQGPKLLKKVSYSDLPGWFQRLSNASLNTMGPVQTGQWPSLGNKLLYSSTYTTVRGVLWVDVKNDTA